MVRADEGAVHALRPEGREAARGSIRLSAPDHRSPSGRGRSTGNLTEAQVIQSMEAAVGFNVVIDVLASAAYVGGSPKRALRRGHDGEVANRLGSEQPHLPLLRHRRQRQPSGYSNPRLDYVLANALRATDPKARAVDYRVAQQIMHADRPVIVVRENVTYGIFDSDLKGIQFDPFGEMLFANAQYK